MVRTSKLFLAGRTPTCRELVSSRYKARFSIPKYWLGTLDQKHVASHPCKHGLPKTMECYGCEMEKIQNHSKSAVDVVVISDIEESDSTTVQSVPPPTIIETIHSSASLYLPVPINFGSHVSKNVETIIPAIPSSPNKKKRGMKKEGNSPLSVGYICRHTRKYTKCQECELESICRPTGGKRRATMRSAMTAYI